MKIHVEFCMYNNKFNVSIDLEVYVTIKLHQAEIYLAISNFSPIVAIACSFELVSGFNPNIIGS